jgi:pyruvate formate lyase activating enzyme
VLWPQKLSDLPLQDIRDFISSHGDWLDGIVISGGEPCLNQGLPHLINEFRNLDLKIKLDTNGSRPELLKQIIADGLVDYVAMDFKAPLNELSYRRCTGVRTDIKAIGRSLDLLLEGNVDYEFRVTICPSLLDVDDIKNMGERIEGAQRFVLQNVVPQNTLDISMGKLVPYTMEKLEKMKQAISHNVKECLIISSY